MDFIPYTSQETQAILDDLGLRSKSDLFKSIPQPLLNPKISLPEPLTEWEITETMEAAASQNRGTEMLSFLGGGAYDHFIPAAVPALVSRGDFLTAYTPYQPEVSQGTLQAIYEFQTLICRLTGMEVANASMYDGSSALAEAALMSCRVKRKEKIAISTTINPRYRRVVKTYLDAQGIEIVEIPQNAGAANSESLRELLDDSFAGFFIQNPNYYGILEPVYELRAIVREAGCLLGAVVYPHSLGLLKSPGSWDADIVVGDLQSLGLPLQYGGPYAGFIASKMKFNRQLPGRIVGRTKDENGDTGYVLTLQTREQHIRRAKATSNICSNQALCALASTVYLSLLGANGLRRAAEFSVQRAHDLQARLCELEGVNLLFDRLYFNEFLIELPFPAETFVSKAKAANVMPGIPVSVDGEDCLLVCATEKTSPSAIARYVSTLTYIINQS